MNYSPGRRPDKADWDTSLLLRRLLTKALPRHGNALVQTQHCSCGSIDTGRCSVVAPRIRSTTESQALSSLFLRDLVERGLSKWPTHPIYVIRMLTVCMTIYDSLTCNSHMCKASYRHRGDRIRTYCHLRRHSTSSEILGASTRRRLSHPPSSRPIRMCLSVDSTCDSFTCSGDTSNLALRSLDSSAKQPPHPMS